MVAAAKRGRRTTKRQKNGASGPPASPARRKGKPAAKRCKPRKAPTNNLPPASAPIRYTVTSVTEVARATGKTRPTIYKWIEQGMPVNPDGSYHLPTIFRWSARRELERELAREGPSAAKKRSRPGPPTGEEPEGSTPDLLPPADWQEMYEMYRAQLAGLKVEEESGRLAPLDEMKRVWERHITDAKTILEGLPDRILLHLPSEIRSAVKVQVEREVERTLRTLAGDEDE